MGRYFRRRLLTAIPVFFGITFLVFVLLSLSPADVTDLGEGASGGAQQAALEEALGLDKPLPVRYLAWLGGLLRGELGQSYLSGRPVAGMLAQRVGPSLLLTGTGVLLAILLALPLGILAAWRPRSGWDRAASALSLVSFGVPGFFLCLVGVLLFSVLLGWLPSQGMYEYGVFTGVGDVLRHLALPAGVVCVSGLGELVKQTRSACLESLGEDYILTARAKGLGERAVMVRHAFRGALTPVLTTVLGHIPHIIGGSVVVEQVFGWPGMGSLLFWGIENRDYPVVMGVTVVIALAVLLLPPLLGLEPNASDLGAGFWAPPSAAHPLGTDDVGRDLLARLLCGGRVSLLIGLCSAALSALVGIPLGLLAGYRRGAWEFCLMRLADVFQSFPSIVLVLCLVSLVGPSALNLVLVLGLLGWTGIARLVYGNTLSVREKEYVLAARALGGRTGRILRSNVLPNVIAPVWCALPLRAGRAILSESSLSFLGVGIRTPQASWGNLIQYAASLPVLTGRPWVWVPPGLCIILTVLCLQGIGDGLRDALDPRYGGHRGK